MEVRSQFHDQINDLHQKLLEMGVMVEEALYKAVKSLCDKDVRLARMVIEEDKRVNQIEVDIEKECFSLIALQQPVGSQLRRIVTSLKVATDLERMADHAVSIAKTTIRLEGQIYAKPLIDIPKMAHLVQQFVRDALDAYIQMNHEASIVIAKKDDEIDAYFQRIFAELIQLMSDDSNLVHQATHLLLVVQYLERIGDYATNICEWVVYMKEGRIVELND